MEDATQTKYKGKNGTKDKIEMFSSKCQALFVLLPPPPNFFFLNYVSTLPNLTHANRLCPSQNTQTFFSFFLQFGETSGCFVATMVERDAQRQLTVENETNCDENVLPPAHNST